MKIIGKLFKDVEQRNENKEIIQKGFSHGIKYQYLKENIKENIKENTEYIKILCRKYYYYYWHCLFLLIKLIII